MLGNRLQIHSAREESDGIDTTVAGDRTPSGDVSALPPDLRELCFGGMGLRGNRPSLVIWRLAVGTRAATDLHGP